MSGRRPPATLALVALAPAAAIALVAVAGALGVPRGPIDLRRAPRTVMETQPFAVGDTYTVGTVGVPTTVPRPVTVTRVEVLYRSGVEVVGLGAYSPDGDGVALVRGWPPPGIEVRSAGLDGPAWPGNAYAAIGLRVAEPRSGFRGVRMTWIDGAGNAGSRVDDLAAYTCTVGDCDIRADESGPLLLELGLVRP